MKKDEYEEVERNIDRLRVAMLAQEKTRRKEEELARRDKKNKSKSQLKDPRATFGNKCKEFTMDISGAVVPVMRLPPNRLREMQPVARAKVVADSMIVNSPQSAGPETVNDTLKDVSAIAPPADQSQEQSKAAEEDQGSKSSAALSKSMVGSESTVGGHMADLSALEPSFGVTVKVGSEAMKRGPSVMDDPKLMSKTSFAFLQHGKLATLAGRRAISSVPRAAKLKAAERQLEASLEEDEEESKLDAESLLVRVPPVYGGGKLNKTFVGMTPTAVAQHVRYSSGNRTTVHAKHTRVIIAKEYLQKNMEMVEERAARRVSTAAAGQKENTVHKKRTAPLCNDSF